MIFGVVGSNIAMIVGSWEVASQIKEKTPYCVVGKFKTREEAEQFLFDHRRNEFIRSLKVDTYGYKSDSAILVDYKVKSDNLVVSLNTEKCYMFKKEKMHKELGKNLYKYIIPCVSGLSLKQEINRLVLLIKSINENYDINIKAHNISIPLAIYQYSNLFPVINDVIKSRQGKTCFSYEKRFYEE